MNFGKALKKMMIDKDMRGNEVAAKMGVSSAYVSALATGLKNPSLRTVIQLSDVLGCKPSELIAEAEK